MIFCGDCGVGCSGLCDNLIDLTYFTSLFLPSLSSISTKKVLASTETQSISKKQEDKSMLFIVDRRIGGNEWK